MASPFKQKGKKPVKKKTAKQIKSESKAAHFGAKGYYAETGGSASVSADGPNKIGDAKVEAKGVSAKPHGAAGVKGRTHFTAASKALALAKGELSEEYTIASVLREPNRG
tara:strand:- start:291 stop:620 length:330 start_codon:yes stop_codon:yes gene_type:complete